MKTIDEVLFENLSGYDVASIDGELLDSIKICMSIFATEVSKEAWRQAEIIDFGDSKFLWDGWEERFDKWLKGNVKLTGYDNAGGILQ